MVSPSLLSQLFIRFIVLLPAFTDARDVGKTIPKDEQTWETQFGAFPYRSFRTEDLVAPVARKAADSPQCHDENYIFLALRGKQVSRPALTILDNQGEVVWQRHVKGEPYNLNVQEYQGEQVVTFWLGDDTIGGHGEGVFYIYNNKYEEIANISGSPGLRPDLHELIITPAGTAIVTIFQVNVVNKPGLFRLKDTVWVWDCLFQEIDISTGKTVFEWRASDHHDLNETYRPIGGDGFSKDHPWDFYHINSVYKDELGNYLVSARYTNTITYIDGKTGKIKWVLGGKKNSFQDLSKGGGQATNMAYQHSAGFHSLTDFPNLLSEEIKVAEKDGVTRRLLTAFDNVADDWKYDRVSRGVLVELTYPTNHASKEVPYTARLVKSYEHPAKFVALSQGNIQVIPSKDSTSDPKVLIGYGHVGVWTEFSADGKVLCDNRLSTVKSWSQGSVQNYRTYKSPWKGQPSLPPDVAIGSASSLLVSWNGATEVKSWTVQRLENEKWMDVAHTEKTGFETEIEFDVDDDTKFLRVVALDKDGHTLGASEGLDLKPRKGFTKNQIAVGLVGAMVFYVLYRSLQKMKYRRQKALYDKLPKYA